MNNYKTLMKGRLGMFDATTNISNGTENMSTRLGGQLQQQRMIHDKVRSLQRALYYSYQGADVQLLSNEETEPVRALINPNRLKQDYDDKIISIEYKYNFKCGDIFEWCNTNTHWIIYLQDLTELAYFKGDIRKCNYMIQWEDAAGNLKQTYAAVRGPVESKIDSTEKNGTNIDLPNSSLNIIIPKNEDTLAYFKRYAKFYLQEDKEICWRIEGVDSISGNGIIELNAIEYYSNKDNDDLEQGIVDGQILPIIDPNPVAENIIGETFIKPKVEYIYKYVGDTQDYSWMVDSRLPITYNITEENNIVLKWNKVCSGQFDLICGADSKTIIVESLF